MTPRVSTGVPRALGDPKALHWGAQEHGWPQGALLGFMGTGMTPKGCTGVLRAMGDPHGYCAGGARPQGAVTAWVNQVIAQPPGWQLCQALLAACAWLCHLIGWQLPVGARCSECWLVGRSQE